MNMTIREAGPADQSVIADFNSRLADETEGKQLDPALIGPGVKALLADATKGRYWLAIIDGKVAGQIMVTYEWSDWRNGMLWWIQSVYVPAEFRRQGVFSALFQHVESLVKEDQNACGLRLYVENNNTRAQETYRNLAMVEPGYIVMESLLPK
ncbi:MAG: GNAT family N-acetyltransferase [Woeseiaceae bacterium]